MKKGLLVMIAFALFLTFGLGQADAAKRGGGFKSPKQSYTTTPKKPAASESTSGTKTNTGATTSKTGTTASKGFFGGGSFMKGMLVGGIAGMLFGGMMGSMGGMGQFFGLIINLLAIFVLVRIVISLFRMFKKKNNPDSRRPY
jgi:predicted lipid-binding transport protein (Tim44 family)